MGETSSRPKRHGNGKAVAVFAKRREVQLAFLALAAALAGLGVWLYLTDPQSFGERSVVGVALIALFGVFGLPEIARDMRKGVRQLVISREGVLARDITERPIPWENIDEIYVRNQAVRGMAVPEIVIRTAGTADIRPRSPLRRALFSARRRVFGAAAIIPVSRLACDRGDVVAAVDRFLPKRVNPHRAEVWDLSKRHSLTISRGQHRAAG